MTATARIYLGSSFHRDHHQARAKQVREYLAANLRLNMSTFPLISR